jgi:glycosyltransferase involved in cell wall biosynthesis
MRIGHIIVDTEHSVHLDMSKAMHKRGHDVKVYAEDPRAACSHRFTMWQEDGVEVYAIHNIKRNPWLYVVDKLFKPLLGRRFFTSLYALYRYIRSSACDIYLVEGDWMGVFVALIGYFRPIKWIVFMHDHEQLGVLLGYPGEPSNWLRVKVKHWVLRRATGLRANSEVTRDIMVQSGIAAARIKVVRLHYSARMLAGGDIDAFRAGARTEVNARWAIPASCKLLLCMCRLTPFKGLDLALQACALTIAKGVNARLMICGADRIAAGVGSYRAFLERLAHELGIFEQVIFTDNISTEEVRNYYAAADLHLVPSYVDTFNYSAVEAAMVGTPSIVTPLTGCGPWLAQAGAAWILCRREPQEMAAAITSVFGSDTHFGDPVKMAANTKEILAPDNIAEELLTYIAQIYAEH